MRHGLRPALPATARLAAATERVLRFATMHVSETVLPLLERQVQTLLPRLVSHGAGLCAQRLPAQHVRCSVCLEQH